MSTIKKGNIISALNQAINEFAEFGATAVTMNAPVNIFENRRLIAVFTNNFDIETNKHEHDKNSKNRWSRTNTG